jgi:hypothetical protein
MMGIERMRDAMILTKVIAVMMMMMTIATKVIAVMMMMMTRVAMSIFTAVPPRESAAIAATEGRRGYRVMVQVARIAEVLSRASGWHFQR